LRTLKSCIGQATAISSVGSFVGQARASYADVAWVADVSGKFDGWYVRDLSAQFGGDGLEALERLGDERVAAA
jgi:hypothetical protein